MDQELAFTEIPDEEGSNPNPIDLEARLSEVRGEMDRRLYRAAVTGDDNFLNTVLEGNVDRDQLFSACDVEGNTCLHLAVMGGRHFRFIGRLVSYEPKLALVRNRRGLTPLSLAAGSQDKLVGAWIWFTIEQAVRESQWIIKLIVMDIDDNGDTAAHHALRNGHDELAFRLIASTPEVATLVNKRSESLMYLACWNGHTFVLGLLKISGSARDAPAGNSVLMAAVLAGKTGSWMDLLVLFKFSPGLYS